MISVAGVVAGAIVLVSVPMRAQDETALKQAFEGKRVILKIDMPATSKGVDVWPERDLPVEFSDVANRLKSNGIAIRTGEAQMITKGRSRRPRRPRRRASSRRSRPPLTRA
jgi:hypothetical protein